MASKIAVWSADEAYKAIRRGIKQSELSRYALFASHFPQHLQRKL